MLGFIHHNNCQLRISYHDNGSLRYDYHTIDIIAHHYSDLSLENCDLNVINCALSNNVVCQYLPSQNARFSDYCFLHVAY